VPAPRALFLGGTGIISSACVAEALALGLEVTVLNRGKESARPLPDGVEVLIADVRDLDSMRGALGGREFDTVVDFIAFTVEHVALGIELFSGRTGQFVFISSASAYQKPIRHLPITESTPLVNPFWQYSRDKIACEDRLMAAHRDQNFPITIVRPSHTYDRTLVPLEGGWTVIERYRAGKPVVVPGDGTSLWVLTHHRDFARAFVRLLANPKALGDAVHITSDDVLTWNQIHEILADAAGVRAPKIVHVASETFAEFLPTAGPGLIGDKSHSVMFDNTKIRQLAPGWVATIPFATGAREIIDWHDADAARRPSDHGVDDAFDRLVAFARRR